MSEKDLEVRNKTQGGIIWVSLSKMNLFEVINLRIFPFFPSIRTLKKKSKTLVKKVSAMMSKLHFLCLQDRFREKNYLLKKFFFFKFFLNLT